MRNPVSRQPFNTARSAVMSTRMVRVFAMGLDQQFEVLHRLQLLALGERNIGLRVAERVFSSSLG